MKKRKIKSGRLTEKQLEAMSRDFEKPDYSPRFLQPPLAQRRRHNLAIGEAKRKRGRPLAGKGAMRIQITLERTLLARADNRAKLARMSRSELIAHGLRLALAS